MEREEIKDVPIDSSHGKDKLPRRFRLVLFAVMALASLVAAAPRQMKPIVANTSEPGVPLGINRQIAAETEEDYQKKLAERAAKDPTFVSIKVKPKGLSSSARFGSGFPFEGHNCSWALDGDEEKGYLLYVDLNANGDLSDDSPLKLEKQGRVSVCLFKATVHDLKKDPQQTYPLTLKLEIANLTAPGQAQARPYLSIHARTVRQGAAHIGQKDVAFSIQGAWGLYDWEASEVFFDLNGDGQLDGANPFAPPHDSTERFRLSDKYVNIGETSYEFAVDRYGRYLTLTPLAEKLPARPTLFANSPAPDFTFTGLDGKAHKLSDYRGKVVLLDFWGAWCSPCVAAVPKLREAYEKYQARGFEILGVDADDTEEQLRSFITEKKLTWMQAREEQAGPIHRLYRVLAWPSYFLIGQDGKIVMASTGGSRLDLSAELEKLLPAAEK